MPTAAEVVTPERILYSGEAEFVVLRADGGEIMFLPEHAPFIAAVDICVLRIAREGEDEFRAAIHGGFVRTGGNSVTILASVAEPADEIDVDRARRARDAAQAALGSAEPAAGGERPQSGGQSGDGEPVETSPVMQALLYPDDPEVALRRAEARLEAAGALEPTH